MTRPTTAQQAIEWANVPQTCWFSTSSGRIELALTLADAQSGSHSGQCDADIAALLGLPYIAEQINAIDPKLLADELSECGAWEGDELKDHAQNQARILWLACSDIVEQSIAAE